MNYHVKDAHHANVDHGAPAEQLVELCAFPVNQHPGKNEDELGGNHNILLKVDELVEPFYCLLTLMMLDHSMQLSIYKVISQK